MDLHQPNKRCVMPISTKALAGLRAAIEWNPDGGQLLLAILIEYAAWMNYKDDTYGPLGLILFGVPPTKRIGNGISISIKPRPFPEDSLIACKVFGDEWKQRRFTKQELAEIIETMLIELNVRL
jgi:hypothetical protein